TRAQDHSDPGRHRNRPRARLDDRVRGRYRDRVRVARHGQAADRIDLPPRSPGGGRLFDRGGDDVRSHQSRGRRDLHAARPARAPCDQGGVSVATPTDSGFADAAAESRLAGAWREFSESRTAVVALAIVVLLIGLSLLAPLIVPQNPYDLTQLSIMDNK